ncbi:MAG: MFS transporter [Euryarchaeota archaeon]|nr:MFS transporter [Euryarchaeota archaeon]
MDRRTLLLLGFAVGAVAATLQFLARTPETLLAARFAFGIAMGMIPPTLAAYVYDVKRPLGKFTSYNAFGWLLASLLVIGASHAAGATAPRWLSGRFAAAGGPVPLVFITAAVFCVVAFAFAMRLRPMRLGLNVPLFPGAVIAKNLHVYLSIFVRHLGAASIWIIYPLYIVELGGDLALVGWVHVVNMVAQVLVYRNVESLRRIGTAPVLIAIGLVLSAITFASFALVKNAYQLLPLQAPLGVSFACLWLGSMKEVMEHNVERATATGLLNASMNASSIAGPLLGGLIAFHVGFRGTMVFASAITVVAFLVFLALRPAAGTVVPPAVAPPGGPSDVAQG